MLRFFREFNSKWTYLSSEKKTQQKKNGIRWLVPHKAWNQVVSRRSRAMTAKHMQGCRFAIVNLFFFLFIALSVVVS